MTDQTVTPAEPADQPDPYVQLAADLRSLADDMEKLAGQPAPTYFSMDIHPHTPTPGDRAAVGSAAETVAAVDAVSMALLGRLAATKQLSNGTFHHTVAGRRGGISLGIYQVVADPDAVDPQKHGAPPADPTGVDFSDLADRLAVGDKPIPPDADVIALGHAAEGS